MIGLLWFDDDPNRDLEQKVGNAAKRYREKFGHQPTVCYVHPSMLNGLVGSDNSTGEARLAPAPLSLDIGDLHLRVVPRPFIDRTYALTNVAQAARPVPCKLTACATPTIASFLVNCGSPVI